MATEVFDHLSNSFSIRASVIQLDAVAALLDALGALESVDRSGDS